MALCTVAVGNTRNGCKFAKGIEAINAGIAHIQAGFMMYLCSART
jgi:hypothetical protein